MHENFEMSYVCQRNLSCSATDNDGGDGGVLSAIGHKLDPCSFTYASRDVILYALGGKR